jgi:hypothetical protein
VVKARLGLDGAKSWVVIDDANLFHWPGPDLRFLPRHTSSAGMSRTSNVLFALDRF